MYMYLNSKFHKHDVYSVLMYKQVNHEALNHLHSQATTAWLPGSTECKPDSTAIKWHCHSQKKQNYSFDNQMTDFFNM